MRATVGNDGGTGGRRNQRGKARTGGDRRAEEDGGEKQGLGTGKSRPMSCVHPGVHSVWEASKGG